jgi:hypothetical protein
MGTRTLTYRQTGLSPLTAADLISAIAGVQQQTGAHVPLERISLEMYTGDPDRGDDYWYLIARWNISTPGE